MTEGVHEATKVSCETLFVKKSQEIFKIVIPGQFDRKNVVKVRLRGKAENPVKDEKPYNP